MLSPRGGYHLPIRRFREECIRGRYSPRWVGDALSDPTTFVPPATVDSFLPVLNSTSTNRSLTGCTSHARRSRWGDALRARSGPDETPGGLACFRSPIGEFLRHFVVRFASGPNYFSGFHSATETYGLDPQRVPFLSPSCAGVNFPCSLSATGGCPTTLP